MTVIVAENTPDKVRGLLKRWFLEPKPNVFVGTVNRRTREKVLAYILKYAPDDLALLVICDDASSQGFSVVHYREPAKRAVKLSGLYLVETIPKSNPESSDVKDQETDSYEISTGQLETTEEPNSQDVPNEEVNRIMNQGLIGYQFKK